MDDRIKNCSTAVDGSEILHQLRLVVSHYLQGFSNIPNGWPWDFWTINSTTPYVDALQLSTTPSVWTSAYCS